MSLHPLLSRLQPTRRFRRPSNNEVMRLSPRDLVRYCDRLLNQDAALDVLTDCFRPSRRGQGGYRTGRRRVA